MADLKKHKKLYLALQAVIALAFIFIFRNITVIKASGIDAEKAVKNLYFLNVFLIISISLLCIVFIMSKKNKMELSQSLTVEADEISSSEELLKKRNEIYENETKSKLAQLEKTLLSEKTKEKMFDEFLKIIVKQTESVQAALFITIEKEEKKMLSFVSGYAFYVPENDPMEFHFGEGLSGQAAMDKKTLNLSEIKVDRIPVYSGMGSSVPQNLLICPMLFNNETIGVLELASFRKYEQHDEQFVENAATLLGSLIVKI